MLVKYSCEKRFFVRYAMLLKLHPNARYHESLGKLALIELTCILEAWGLQNAKPRVELLAAEPFLIFEAEEMTNGAWRALSRHSAICLAGELLVENAIRPVQREIANVLPNDLPQVLKYKGKTNTDFTYMMLHVAKAASSFSHVQEALKVLDPMCGKATTLFCAMCEGNAAIGVEMDRRAIAEADTYFSRSLKLHRLKHRRTTSSITLIGGGSVQATDYAVAATAQDMRQGAASSLRLVHGDAARVGDMFKQESFHLLVCDLPYGVQHAPRESGGMSSMKTLLSRVSPGFGRVLKHGGAAALAFNLNTLRRSDVAHALESAGLEVLDKPPYDDFSHWVEQAVERDMVVARKP